MRVKICGITQPAQGRAIAQLGATALGFICVPTSPRYVSPEQIRAIVDQLRFPLPDRIGVFADAAWDTIQQVAQTAQLSGVQLHSSESPDFCRQLRQVIPDLEIIKALRVKTSETLTQAELYQDCVDTLLLDAFHPQQLGGTGETLDWQSLQQFCPSCPWFLAGGLNPDNIQTALSLVKPDGIDLSSGVERSPGNKDLEQVARLFAVLKSSDQKILFSTH
jgi:phosphoribosylanthranilate isomerase